VAVGGIAHKPWRVEVNGDFARTLFEHTSPAVPEPHPTKSAV
jgi:hypothetical protein